MQVTCTAPVNIAVIKYWGKRDSDLILPTNSSLSVTLSQDDMQSKTTIRASSKFNRDRLWLNGEEQDIQKNKRFKTVIQESRKLRVKLEEDLKTESEGKGEGRMSEWPLHIVSENNFPTAAGLASSASGFACLAYALATLYELKDKNVISDSEISKLARVGSGSACRSVFGGFVAWEMGQAEDGHDSMAVQIADAPHWPDMSALILVTNADKKHTPSTAGMQTSVDTSDLIKHRIQHSVPERMTLMKNAILGKDFDSFAEITMKESNQFHAVCLDTFPPIAYLTDVSHQVIRFITAYNTLTATASQKFKAAYTFDAGPNAVIYASKENIPEILALIDHFFPCNEACDKSFYYGSSVVDASKLNPELISALESKFSIQADGCLSRIISTKIGDGPRIFLNANDSLMNEEGFPKV